MPSSAQARRFYRAAKQRFDDALLLVEMENRGQRKIYMRKGDGSGLELKRALHDLSNRPLEQKNGQRFAF